MLTQNISRTSSRLETECSYGSSKKIKIHVTCHWRQGRFCENARGKGGFGATSPIARHPASTKVSVFARSRPCSYAPRARGTRGRAESRPDGRPSRVRARTRTRPRLLFPANLVDVRRARPADSRLGRLRRRSSRPRRDGFFSRWSSTGRPSRGPNGGSRSARDSTSRVCHGTPISSMGFVASRAFRSIGRSSGARPRTRHRDARATLGDDDRLVIPRATRIFRARALARLDERSRSSSFRVQIRVVRGGGNIRGNVALGADFRLEKRDAVNEVARRE